tara:strand:- start:9345 stop:10262 length:918 start_codon:yes stop_codon:yes gene_type:complete
VSESKNRGVIGILLMVFIFFVILMIFAFYTVNAFKKSNFDNQFMNTGKESIAVVEINGPIITSKDTIERLHQAEKDKRYKAVIVRINSPGGPVAPTQEIYQEIRRIDESVKPVYTSFGSIAASGGYYVGTAGRKIFSNPGTLTGSIGVISQFVDLSKLLKSFKINPYIIKAGKYKDLGQPTRALTKEEKIIMKKLLKNVHKQFVNDILKTRKDKIKGNIWQYAQGQVFSGEEAEKYGLVDELAGLWDAGRKIHKELGIKSPFGLKFIKKKKKLSLMQLVEGLDDVAKGMTSNLLSQAVPMFLYKQ